ncbi:unnamed protein product [Laminaria digitata]
MRNNCWRDGGTGVDRTEPTPDLTHIPTSDPIEAAAHTGQTWLETPLPLIRIERVTTMNYGTLCEKRTSPAQ